MALVDVETARRELRVGSEVLDADIVRKLETAQEQAEAFLGRNLYADQNALNAAIAAAPAALSAATAALDTALTAAALLTVTDQREAHERLAKDAYNDAFWAWNRTVRGMVAIESVKTAVLLIAGGLSEHGGDEQVPAMPQAARDTLWPFRTGLGV